MIHQVEILQEKGKAVSVQVGQGQCQQQAKILHLVQTIYYGGELILPLPREKYGVEAALVNPLPIKIQPNLPHQ